MVTEESKEIQEGMKNIGKGKHMNKYKCLLTVRKQQ